MTTHKIRGLFITHNNSPINKIEQLKGKTISLTPPITVLHQMVLSKLNEHGITPEKNITIKQIKTFSNAIHDVLNKSSDAALTGIKIWHRLPIKTKSKLKVFSQTAPTTGFVVLAKPDIDNTVIKNLQHSFLAFNNTESGKNYIFKGFKLITDADMMSLDFHSKYFEKQ